MGSKNRDCIGLGSIAPTTLLDQMRHLGGRLGRVCLCVFIAAYSSEADQGGWARAENKVKNFYFDHFSVNDGLSSVQVNCISQDSIGHIWVGTDCGLNRFDGFRFKSFASGEHAAVRQGRISSVASLPSGKILYGGASGLCMQYDPLLNTFSDKRPLDYSTSYQKNLTAFFSSRDGGVMAITSNGAYSFDSDSNAFSLTKGIYASTCNFSIQCISQDQMGRYWLLTPSSLLVMDKRGKIVFERSYKFSSCRSANAVVKVVDDGVAMVYTNEGIIQLFKYGQSGEISEGGWIRTPFGNLRSIAVDKRGRIWFATDGNGLWYCKVADMANPESYVHVVPFGVDDGDFSKLYSMFIDSRQILWIGTQNSGLWKLKLGQKGEIEETFRSFDLGIPRCLATSFVDLNNGSYLASCDGSGVLSFNLDSHHSKMHGRESGLVSLNVTNISADKAGNIWATTWGSGLYVSSDSGAHFKSVPFNGIISPSNNLFSVTQLRNGDYWVCAGRAGIYRLHNDSWSLLEIFSPEYGPDPDKWPYFIIQDDKDRVWIFTSTTVWIYDGKAFHPVKAKYHGGDSDPVNINDACFVDGIGVVAATDHGIFYFDENGDNATWINSGPGHSYGSIAFVGGHNVVASGDGKIEQANLDSKTVTTLPYDFSKKGKNYFYVRSKLLTRFDRVIFGTREGFFSCRLKKDMSHAADDFVGLAELSINGKPVTYAWSEEDNGEKGSKDGKLAGRSLELTFDGDEIGTLATTKTGGKKGGELCFSHGMQNIDFKLDILDFDENQPYYVYRLKGLSDDWMPVAPDQEIFFNYLPSGDYVLEVSNAYLAKNGQENLLEFRLLVLPPWWKSWWFVLLMLVVVVGGTLLKIRSLRRDRQLLRDAVDEATKEIRQKNVLVEKRNTELSKVLNSKDRIITVVAHDLKNPVFAIVGALEGIERRGDEMDGEERKTLFAGVLKSARSLQTELSKLLSWATSSQDDLEYRPTDADLQKIILDEMELMRSAADNKHVNLVCNIELKNKAYIDTRMMSVVIRNLLTNSIKFTPQEKCVTVRAWQDEEHAFVEVCDQGVGMSAEKISELAREGRHESTGGTNGEKGTGLGFMVIKDYVLQNGGKLDISSRPQNGTTIRLTLPRSQQELVASPLAQSQALPAFSVDSQLMEGNTVLVVDDDELICQSVRIMLNQYVNVLIASNGSEALDIVLGNRVDVIVSDVEMPVMNGIDMSMKLAADERTNFIPLLFFSAKSAESDRLIGLLTGAIDYIPKPFSQNELLIKVQNILALRRRVQSHLLEERLGSISGQTLAGGDDEADTNTSAVAKNAEEAVCEKTNGKGKDTAGAAISQKTATAAAEETAKEDRHAKPETAGKTPAQQAKFDPVLQKMFDLLEKKYSDSNYSVEAMASDMCMTKITLYRRLKTLTGQTPIEVINSFRLNKAMALLKKGEMSVGDIGFAVGYSDPAYFTRRFRAFFNCSPSQVKNKD